MTVDTRTEIDAVLDRLPTADWTVFRDVPWPGRPHVSIPHVAIGPGGVFVIEGETTRGPITIAKDGLRVHGHRREGALTSQKSAATAIGERLVTLDVHHVHGVVCFVSEQEIEGRAKGVMVGTTATLEKQLLGQPNYFSQMRARSIADDVRVAVSDDAQPAAAMSHRRTAAIHREAPPEKLRERSGRREARLGSMVLGAAGLMVGMFALLMLASMWSLFAGVAETDPASAQDTAVACQKVNAKHPHGIGRPNARDKVGHGLPRVKHFTVARRMYREVRDLDLDRDGIACERR